MTSAEANHPITLRIAGGVHDGAWHLVTPGDVLLIGRAEDADIILRDADVPHHLAWIQRRGHLLHLRILADGLQHANSPLAPGDVVRLAASAQLTLGAVTLHLEFPTPEASPESDINTSTQTNAQSPWFQTTPHWLRRVTATSAGCILLLLAAALMSSLFSEKKAPILAPSTEAEAVAVERHQANLRAQQLAASVKEVLRLSGITAEASVIASGVVEIRGEFKDPQLLEQILASRSIREIKGLRRVSVQGMIPPSRAPIDLKIQAIVHGSDPYVLATDGTHYYPGARLNNDLTLKAIDQEKAILEAPNGKITTWTLSGGAHTEN